MKLGIIGAGVVGVATGRALESKHSVFYYDKFKKDLSSQENINRIASEAEIVFVCVPTPMRPSGEMDYSAIYSSLEQLLTASNFVRRNPYSLVIVIRSTAVSGTTDKVAEKFPFRFAFNPEFLREKHAEEDMRNTNRVVIGANEKSVSDKLVEMYKEVFPDANYICVDIKTAEMIKYVANVMLAAQISIANEIFRICKGVGIDYNTVKMAVLQDPRIGSNIDVPGHDGEFGFGGKCFPKDLRALIYMARERNVEPYLLDEVWRSNLSVRAKHDWLDIQGATTGNNF
jgi:UDPglucose 6-dehydrogenase